MFDVVNTLLIQLIGILPAFIPLVLVMNLIAGLLWGKGE